MIYRVAFTLIGGNNWIGGLNYQVNLLSALLQYEYDRIRPILFLGEDISEELLGRFQRIPGLQIIQSEAFDRNKKFGRLIASIIVGKDHSALKLFKSHQVHAAFEIANFYGWRFPIKTIAWIPDLQHQRLRHYFSPIAFWKREIGFQMQIHGGRHIMLSSEATRRDLQQFYRTKQHRIHVVKFSVPVEVHSFDSGALIAKYGLPTHFFYLPNQFWRHKNHECVVHALAIAKQSGHSLTVAVSGNTEDPRDPDYFPSLLALAKKLGVENNFIVLGLIPYEDVQGLMVSCDALVNPSRFEGWSTTVEEAKVLGTGMLLSDIGVHWEQAGEYAVYFNLDDAQSLADILVNYPKRTLSEKIQLSNIAVKQARNNMSAFATDFTDMVIEVAGQR